MAYTAPFAATDIQFARLEFGHPLYVMYSSGTTGVRNASCNGAGGTLLKHIVEQQFHCDVRPATDCSISPPALDDVELARLGPRRGATLLLYDGSPFHPDGNMLFDFAEQERMTQLGTSANTSTS